MQKKNNNGILIGILIGLVIAIVIVGCLFATGAFKTNTTTDNEENITENTENNEVTNNNDESNKYYLDFINKKEYSTDNIPEEYKKVSYAIYDLNKDGIDELLLRFTSDEETTNSEWDYTSIHTYAEGKVKLIKTIYAWSGIQFNSTTSEIIYTEVKTSGYGDGTRGNSLGYYKLIADKLELSRTIQYVMNLSTDETKYYEIKDNEKVQMSTDDYNKISANNIRFDFINVETEN